MLHATHLSYATYICGVSCTQWNMSCNMYRHVNTPRQIEVAGCYTHVSSVFVKIRRILYVSKPDMHPLHTRTHTHTHTKHTHTHTHTHTPPPDGAGPRSAIGRAPDSWVRGPGFDTRSGNILSLFLPLFQEGQLSVTGESMCTKYWLTA